MADMWRMYDELIAGIPDDLVVDECVIGTVWTFVKAGKYAGVALTVNVKSRPMIHDGLHAGRKLKDVAAGIKSWNFLEASTGMAAINAYYNSEENMHRLGIDSLADEDKSEEARVRENVFENPAEHMKGKKVTVVGHFPHIERQLGNICQLSILERDLSPDDYPDSACEYILPEQDFVFITGMTMTNKTLPRLLQIAGGNAKISVVGPSTPITPILFDYGVDNISGYCVTEPDYVKSVISQGKRAELFKGGRMISFDK